MSWFRKRKHQFRGVLAFLHPQFLHYSQLAAVLEAQSIPDRDHWATCFEGKQLAAKTAVSAALRPAAELAQGRFPGRLTLFV